MDDIDRASEREQELTREALSKRMPEGPKATGYCLQCGEALMKKAKAGDYVCAIRWAGSAFHSGAYTPNGRRWCDSQCRDDWERAQTKG